MTIKEEWNMSRFGILMRSAGISALIALTATPVLAFPGKADRARTAIAEAPAKENLSRGNKEEAFDDATHAGMLADTAMGVTQKRQNEAAMAQQANSDA